MMAHNIVGRSQTPEKVTVTVLFYLKGLDVGSVNIPYLLARYLRRLPAGDEERGYQNLECSLDYCAQLMIALSGWHRYAERSPCCELVPLQTTRDAPSSFDEVTRQFRHPCRHLSPTTTNSSSFRNHASEDVTIEEKVRDSGH
ncbi:hypothetical protein Tco_0439905 [Tanacetum coccineum]